MANPLTMFRGLGARHRFDFKMKREEGETREERVNVYNGTGFPPFDRPLSPKWNVFPKPTLVMARVMRTPWLNDRHLGPPPRVQRPSDSNCRPSIPPSRSTFPRNLLPFLQTSPLLPRISKISPSLTTSENFFYFFF